MSEQQLGCPQGVSKRLGLWGPTNMVPAPLTDFSSSPWPPQMGSPEKRVNGLARWMSRDHIQGISNELPCCGVLHPALMRGVPASTSFAVRDVLEGICSPAHPALLGPLQSSVAS